MKMTETEMINHLGEKTIQESEIASQLECFISLKEKYVQRIGIFSINRYMYAPLSELSNDFYFNLGGSMFHYHHLDINGAALSFLDFDYNDFDEFFIELTKSCNQSYEDYIDFVLEDRLFKKNIDWNKTVKEYSHIFENTGAHRFLNCQELTLFEVCEGVVLSVPDQNSMTLNSYFMLGYYGLTISFLRKNIERLEEGKTTVIDLDDFLNLKNG